MKLIALLLGVALSNFYFAHTDSSTFSEETMDYFRKIVLRKTKNPVVSTWKKDIQVFIHPGNTESAFLRMDQNTQQEYNQLEMEFDIIIQELNTWISGVKLKRVKNIKEANFEIYIGSVGGCKLLDASTRNSLSKNWAIQHCQLSTDNKDILHGFVFLDFYRTPNIRVKKRLLRKKVTQALGLFNESDEIKESIFFYGYSEQMNFLPIDKELINILYNHPDVYAQFPCKSNLIDWMSNPETVIEVKTNPIQDELIVHVSEHYLNETIKLYNQQGQVVYFQQIETPNIIIPSTELSSGFYFLQVKNQKSIKVLKN
jgi:hypothetical protein